MRRRDEPTEAIVAALRRIIRRAAPDAEESVAWGALSFHRPWVGGRVKGAVCQIVVKGGRVRLDFIHGVRLSDPERLLEGSGISKRYVSIPSVAAARRPGIARLIREASMFVPETPLAAERPAPRRAHVHAPREPRRSRSRS